MKKKSKRIGHEVLAELEHFGENFEILSTDGPVRLEQFGRLAEPFVCWVHVMESVDGRAETERIYLVCRGHTPLNYSPKDQIAMFANRDSKAGRIASIDPGNEITITLPYNRGRKTIRVVEKDIFLPSKKDDLWDALNNQFSFHLDDEFVFSLRANLAGYVTPTPIREGADQSDEPFVQVEDGLALVEELRELEDAHLQAQLEKLENRLSRVREVVGSIALKDQPVLDATQDNFCRLPLRSKLILSGSPGTGKTTSLIKRVAMKSSVSHLEETDGMSLQDEDRKNWLFFTPNDLLKTYLKEAMSKEGLPATDQFVTTWARERGILGRDVLGFLKRGDKGLFHKTEEILLTDPSSEGITKTALAFIEFFNREFLSSLRSALGDLSRVQIDTQHLSKESYAIVDHFNRFVASVNGLRNQLDHPDGLDPIRAVAELSKSATDYIQLRNEIDGLIIGLVGTWIAENPARFNDLVDFLKASADDKEEPVGATEDTLEESESDRLEREDADPKLLTRNRIRQVVFQQSEARVLGKKLRGKNSQFIWDYLALEKQDSDVLLVVGTLRPALRPAVLRINSFNRLLAEIPRSYRRYRASELLTSNGSNFRPHSGDVFEKQRISEAEIDILVFSMLRLASLISEFGGNGVETDLRRELLGRITDQYRTHIVVDEATDFSAIQLASVYYLANPRYRAVTFSGDLMQRVTSGGLADWKELESLIPEIQRFELIASYRQTPELLRIAKKLYTNIIGEEPPFNSRYAGGAEFPAPLKYVGELDDELATWLAARVFEIYRMNGESLPSIAVFVPTEVDIDIAYGVLKEALNEYSIEVEACKLGKILGTGSNVRIFSIEFIKGLEFEGVFYLDIDRAHEHHPDLIDKYLYVGLTRATTFLGITYSTRFPESFEFLEDDFVFGDWSEFV